MKAGEGSVKYIVADIGYKVKRIFVFSSSFQYFIYLFFFFFFFNSRSVSWQAANCINVYYHWFP
jgi:hypothetical protein